MGSWTISQKMKYKVKKIHHRLDFMDMTTIYEQFDQYQSNNIFS
jgi:hypothetical protein